MSSTTSVPHSFFFSSEVPTHVMWVAEALSKANIQHSLDQLLQEGKSSTIPNEKVIFHYVNQTFNTTDLMKNALLVTQHRLIRIERGVVTFTEYLVDFLRCDNQANGKTYV